MYVSGRNKYWDYHRLSQTITAYLAWTSLIQHLYSGKLYRNHRKWKGLKLRRTITKPVIKNSICSTNKWNLNQLFREKKQEHIFTWPHWQVGQKREGESCSLNFKAGVSLRDSVWQESWVAEFAILYLVIVCPGHHVISQFNGTATATATCSVNVFKIQWDR